jgi:hypothetical protein
MQTYGKFFIRPKKGNKIVGKWRIAGAAILFYQIDQHILDTGVVFSA